MFKEFVKVSNGQLKGSFNLSELITKFRFQVDAVSSTGIYGLSTTPFSTSKDFYLHADMPFTLTAGDKINIPITLSNNLNKPLTVNLFPSTTAETEFLSASIEKQEVVVPAASTEKVMLYIDTFIQLKDRFSLTLRATTSEGLSDAITLESGIIGRGFP